MKTKAGAVGRVEQASRRLSGHGSGDADSGERSRERSRPPRWGGRAVLRGPAHRPSFVRKRGFFITFEGPEGGGKSTHSRQLASWLKRQGKPVLWTREPGGTPLGTKLRKILLDAKHEDLDPFIELLLYEASRALLVRQVIRPALRAGKVVIADRFQDSTWVYQSWAGGMDRPLVEKLGRAATGGLEPDLTILLDLPPRKGLARVKRPNRMEAKSLAFHTKVREGFLVLARRHRKRFRVIAADRLIREVTQAIRKEVADALR